MLPERLETVRPIPFVPERAATAIVRSRRDVELALQELELAIRILRHLDTDVPLLEEVTRRLKELIPELRLVRL
jgi:hypothetical protein